MGRFWLTAFLTLNCFHLYISFILPLKNSNGNLDVDNVIGHMMLLEQTVTGFQQTIKSQDADIAMLKNEISHLKSNQQVITSHHADIAILKTEIVNLKANQQKLDTRISKLPKQMQPGQVSAEVTSLKSEVTQVSNKVTSLTSKFDNLGQDYEKLFGQVKTNQNMTKILRAVQGSLLSQVHSADNDTLLLRSSVNTLNKTLSALSHNSTGTIAVLSSTIAQLKTEVGFNIWLGSSNVYNIQPSRETTLKFRDIQYNKGNGYNTSTGLFTAPVPGTYLFWSQVRKFRGQDLYLYLKRGNTYIGYFYIPTTGDVTGSVIATAAVTAGEQVHVAVYGADSVYCCHYTRFGGALLYRH